MMTDWAFLRSKGRINIGNRHTSNGCLVANKLPKLIKSPRAMSMSLNLSLNRCPLSDAFEIFKDDQRRGVYGFLDKLLGNAMIGVSLEPGFTTRKSIQMFFGTIRTTTLKISFEIIKFGSGLFDLLTRKYFTHRIYRDILNSEIDTKDVRRNDNDRFRDLNDDTKIELFVSKNQISLTSDPVQSRSMVIADLNRSLDPTMDSQQRNSIKPFPREDSLVVDNSSIRIEGWFDRLISLVGFTSFRNGSNCHLGGYSKLLTDIMINNGLQLDFIGCMHLKSNFSHIVASSIELMHSLMEGVRLLWFNYNFDFESLHHDSIDIFDQCNKYLTSGGVQFLPRLKSWASLDERS